MTFLSTLKRSPWMKKKARRVWRWGATWSWNYCGKWCKWQKARSWFSLHAWFEGWQTPLIKQMKKKRWFKRHYKLLKQVSVINLDTLNNSKYIVNGKTYSYSDFVSFGMCHEWSILKVLSSWSLEKTITFSGPNIIFSESSQKKIENSWSSIASE